MKNVNENIQIRNLLEELIIPFLYQIVIADKEVAIKNLKKMKTLREETIKKITEKDRRGFGCYQYMDEILPNINPLLNACINNTSVMDFVGFLDKYCAQNSSSSLVSYLSYTESILKSGFLNSFEGVDKNIMVQCFEKASNYKNVSGNLAFLFYSLKMEGCISILNMIETHPQLMCFDVAKENGEVYFCVKNTYHTYDVKKIPLQELKALEKLDLHSDFFANSDFLLRFVDACQNDDFLPIAQFVCKLVKKDPTSILIPLMDVEKGNLEKLFEILQNLWKKISGIYEDEETWDKYTIMNGILYMAATMSFRLDTMNVFLKNVSKVSKDAIEEAVSSEMGFLNICNGNRYLSLAKRIREEGNACIEKLVITAIMDKKHAFLRLIEDRFDLISDLPGNSILFHPNFPKLCNLNTVTGKNLQILNKVRSDDFIYVCESGKPYLPFLVKGDGYYTFEEIITLTNENSNYQKIYRNLDLEKVDRKLLVIRQLLHENLKISQLTEEQCKTLALHLSEKVFTEWKKDFSRVKGIEPWQIVRLISMMDDEINSIIEEVHDLVDTNIVLNNVGNPLLLENGLGEFRKHFLDYDTDSKWLLEQLVIPENIKNENMDSILYFCTSGYASIVHTYYNRSSTEQKKNILLIAKASMLNMMDKIKYDGFEEELQYQVDGETLEQWKKSLSCYGHGMRTAEYDDFFHCINIGTITGHTCMSYEDGAYSECLLSCFDGNKKVIYVKNDDGYCARAILRLTKFSDVNGNSCNDFGFTDVTEEKKTASGMERLVLFLERPYVHRVNEKDKKSAIQQIVELAKKKATLMGLELVIASNYKDYLCTVPISGYIYISRSKNGKQYLDSLGGKCERGGSYKSGNFHFWNNKL